MIQGRLSCNMKEYVKDTRKLMNEYQKSGEWREFFETCLVASLVLFRHQEWKESIKLIQEALKKSQKLRENEHHDHAIKRLKAYLLFFEGLETSDAEVRNAKWGDALQILNQLDFIPKDINILAPCYQYFLQRSVTTTERFELTVQYLYLAGREDVLRYVNDELGSYREYLEDMARRHHQLETMLLNITDVPLELIWRAYWILMRFKWHMQDYHGVLSLAGNIQVFIETQVDIIPFDELVTVHQWSLYSTLHVQAYDDTVRWINYISRNIRYQPYFIKENEIILEMHVAILEFNGNVLNEWEEVLSYGLPVLEFLQSPQETYISELARLVALARVHVLLSKAYKLARQDITKALEHSQSARQVFLEVEVTDYLIPTWDQIEAYHEELWRESLSLPNPSSWIIFNHVDPSIKFWDRIRAIGQEHQEELFLLWLYAVYRIKEIPPKQNEWWRQLDLMSRPPWTGIKEALIANDATMLPSFEEEKKDTTGIIGIIRPLIEPRLTMSTYHLKSVLKHSPMSIYVKSLLIAESVLKGDFVSAVQYWNDHSIALKQYKDGGDAFITVLRMAILRYISTILDDKGQSAELPPEQAEAFRQLKSMSACFIDDNQLKYLYLRMATWKLGKISLWPEFAD